MAKSIFRRPVDLIYFIYFMIHLTATVLVDLAPLYPAGIIPGVVDQFIKNYRQTSNDPWMYATWDMVDRPFEWIWMKFFMYMEIFIQFPTFTLGGLALLRDDKRFYPLLLIYGVHGSITAAAHLFTVLGAPSQNDPNIDPNLRQFAMTDKQRMDVAVPFLMFLGIPLVMIFDTSIRMLNLMRPGIAAAKAKEKTE
ncbi:hypothetical protein CPB86DRAFT_712262 [Serendipita vermifera]|nr:hypothetical protein CPB86DRAFT_712262 [Serendipita vermifera]